MAASCASRCRRRSAPPASIIAPTSRRSASSPWPWCSAARSPRTSIRTASASLLNDGARARRRRRRPAAARRAAQLDCPRAAARRAAGFPVGDRSADRARGRARGRLRIRPGAGRARDVPVAVQRDDAGARRVAAAPAPVRARPPIAIVSPRSRRPAPIAGRGQPSAARLRLAGRHVAPASPCHRPRRFRRAGRAGVTAPVLRRLAPPCGCPAAGPGCRAAGTSLATSPSPARLDLPPPPATALTTSRECCALDAVHGPAARRKGLAPRCPRRVGALAAPRRHRARRRRARRGRHDRGARPAQAAAAEAGHLVAADQSSRRGRVRGRRLARQHARRASRSTPARTSSSSAAAACRASFP